MASRQSRPRASRPITDDSAQILLLVEGDSPVDALAESEIQVMIGQPPQNLDTGQGYIPAWHGAGNYSRGQYFEYRRHDGLTLRYEYEEHGAYARVDDLAVCEFCGTPFSNPKAGPCRGRPDAECQSAGGGS